MATAIADITTIIIASTMSIDERVMRVISSPRFGMLTISLFVAMSLVVFALPRLMAYGVLLPVEARIAPALAKGKMLAPDILDASIPIYARAANWLPSDSDIQQTLARLYLRRARNTQTGKALRQAALENALARVDQALKAAPNRHFSWALRAEILMLIERPVSEIEKALHLSFLLGPYEASSMLLRARIVLRTWRQVSSDTRQIAEQDLRGQWKNRALRKNLVQFYLQESLSSRVLIRRFALSSQEDVTEFDRLVSRALKQHQ